MSFASPGESPPVVGHPTRSTRARRGHDTSEMAGPDGIEATMNQMTAIPANDVT